VRVTGPICHNCSGGTRSSGSAFLGLQAMERTTAETAKNMGVRCFETSFWNSPTTLGQSSDVHVLCWTITSDSGGNFKIPTKPLLILPSQSRYRRKSHLFASPPMLSLIDGLSDYHWHSNSHLHPSNIHCRRLTHSPREPSRINRIRVLRLSS
jgi:hypothetical protein